MPKEKDNAHADNLFIIIVTVQKYTKMTIFSMGALF